MARVRWIAVAGVLIPLVAGGCGSSDKKTSTTAAPAPAAAGATLKLEADPNGGLSFTSTKLSASAGKVTLSMSNPSSSGKPHGIAVEGNGVDKDGSVVQPGGTSTVTVTLKPGRYEFYCPISAHKKAGMTGTLVVN